MTTTVVVIPIIIKVIAIVTTVVVIPVSLRREGSTDTGKNKKRVPALGGMC